MLDRESVSDLKDSVILVVDDETEIVHLLQTILRHVGFENVVATDRPKEAFRLYQEHRPDAVVLDLHMPGVSGLDLLRQLTEFEPNGYAPILILTGDHDPEYKNRALLSGARDFLVKPFVPVEVIARVRNMLEIRRLYRRSTERSAELERMVSERTRELDRAYREILQRLSLASEYRDDDTGNHTRRIGEYSAVVARGLGMDDEQVEHLRRASPMHDVGKIGIPDSILLKRGKLTSEEWETMKSHVEIGVRILSGATSGLLRVAEEIARSHHERFDGTGYPHGLAGEEIPLNGRLVAVCDVFDALTSERPYKSAWSVEDAVAEISRCRGSHFDPRIVDIFLDNLPQMMSIRDSYA